MNTGETVIHQSKAAHVMAPGMNKWNNLQEPGSVTLGTTVVKTREAVTPITQTFHYTSYFDTCSSYCLKELEDSARHDLLVGLCYSTTESFAFIMCKILTAISQIVRRTQVKQFWMTL